MKFRKLLSLMAAFIMIFALFDVIPKKCFDYLTAKAVSFTQRTTAPSTDNALFYASNPFYQGGYGMPNCTCYAYGRAWEILGSEPKLSHGNANQWYSYNKSNGYYSYGSTPKLGAIACWGGGSAGHVAVVEEINGNSVVISESHYTRNTSLYDVKMWDRKTITAGAESNYISSFYGYIYIGEFDEKNHDPEGDLEFAQGGDRCITVKGWALDRDDMDRAVEVHFYKNEVKAGNGLQGGIMCDQDRGDGTQTGFSATFPVSETGTFEVVAIAKNLEDTGGADYVIGKKTVTVNATSNLGDDFYAQIVDANGKIMTASGSADKPPMLMKMYKPGENIWLTANKTTWHFMRDPATKSYTIWSFAAGEAMELQGAKDTPGTPIQLTSNKTAKEGHQKWYIMEEKGGYSLHPVCNEEMALDVSDGTNVQLMTTGQIFSINKLTNDKTAPVVASVNEKSKKNDTAVFTITVNDTTGVKYVNANVKSWKGDDTKVYQATQSDAQTWNFTINTKDFDGRHGEFYIWVDAYDYFGNKGTLKGISTKLGVYTLKFDGNGITLNEAPRTVVYGYLYARGGDLPAPTRKGYTFTGWYTAASGGTKIDENAKYTQQSDQTLYAHWKQNEYTLTLDPTGGTISNADFTGKTTNTVTSATKLIYNGANWIRVGSYIPTRTGYTFTGFYTTASGGTKVYNADGTCTNEGTYFKNNLYVYAGNLKVYAQWKANTYTVTFDANGGTVSETKRTVTTAKTYGTLPIPSYSGYTFKGWYTAKTGGTKVTEGTVFNAASNQTLYAQWTKNPAATTTAATKATTAATTTTTVAVTTTEPAIKTYTFKGKGTKTEPYQIGNVQDLEAMRDLVNALANRETYAKAYYVQTADIDLKNQKWTPIGKRMYGGEDNTLSYFQGFYNGNYHKIINLNVSETEKFAGLFGSLNRGGIIENLEVHGNVTSTAASAGGVLGELCSGNSIVRNCCFIGDVSGSGTSAGGVVGELWQSGTVENCYHNGTVTNTANSAAGGVVGRVDTGTTADDSAYIKNCYHVGKVTAAGERYGSIVGWMVEKTEKKGRIYVINCIGRMDDADVAYAGSATECEINIFSDKMLRNAAPTLGDAFVLNPDSSFNDGYPVFKWQVKGDVNEDGEISVQDIVALQKWIHKAPNTTLANGTAADLNGDNVVDAFDLALLKRMLLN